MSLARIITRSPESSQQLEKDLLALGFEVETVSPDHLSVRTADVEIRLEECSAAEVLRRAAEIPNSQDMTVFIAPDAITEGARSAQVIPLIPSLQSGPKIIHEPPCENPATAETNMEVLPSLEPQPAELQADTVPLCEPELIGPEPPAIPELVAEPATAEFQAPPADALASDTIETIPEVEAATVAQTGTPELKELLLELESVISGIDASAGVEAPKQAEASVTAQTPVESEPVLESEAAVLESAPPSDWPIWTPPVNEDVPSRLVEVQPQLQVPEAAPRRRALQAFMLASGTAAQIRNKSAIAIGAVHRRMVSDQRVFWGAAVTVGVFAVFGLLLGAAFHRVSPLPAQVSSEEGQIESLSLPAQNTVSPVIPKTLPQSVSVSVSSPLKPASIRKPDRVENDADLIAPDTVVRYVTRDRIAAPKRSAKVARPRTSTHHHADTDVVAEDTVTHFDHPAGVAVPAQKAPR